MAGRAFQVVRRARGTEAIRGAAGGFEQLLHALGSRLAGLDGHQLPSGAEREREGTGFGHAERLAGDATFVEQHQHA